MLSVNETDERRVLLFGQNLILRMRAVCARHGQSETALRMNESLSQIAGLRDLSGRCRPETLPPDATTSSGSKPGTSSDCESAIAPAPCHAQPSARTQAPKPASLCSRALRSWSRL